MCVCVYFFLKGGTRREGLCKVWKEKEKKKKKKKKEVESECEWEKRAA